MKRLTGYVTDFFRNINKKSFAIISLITAAAIFLNYYLGLESAILRADSKSYRFTGFLLLYTLIFTGTYLVIINNKNDHQVRGSILQNEALAGYRQHSSTFHTLIILLTPAIFAVRMASGLITLPVTHILDRPWDSYFAIILNAPLKCLILLLVLYFIKRRGGYRHSITGLQSGSLSLKPFLIIVILFMPLIILAGMQPDFIKTYPRFKHIAFIFPFTSQPWLTALLFEVSYAFDFIFSEVFFRGFLVLAFIRYVGPSAILPMAALYCTIHFGKPLAECISSYFGGIILGAISYRTGSVLGGLVLHLGIGFLMEISGYMWGG